MIRDAETFEALLDSVRRFVRERLVPAEAQVAETDQIPPGIVQEMRDMGLFGLTIPESYGGLELTMEEESRLLFELCRTSPAFRSVIGTTVGIGSQGILMDGTPEQKAHYLPRILSGEDYWCQGYSEPGSGSDLASLQLRAVRDGDDYVLSGSKIWTTHAHLANRMFLLARTAWQGRPQAGISFLLVDMQTPGISIKPIITLAGDHEVNQVFFDEVRTPVSQRLGEENQGWEVAKYLLSFERGGSYAAGLWRALSEVNAMARFEASGDGAALLTEPDFRARLCEAEIRIQAIEMSEHRVLSALTAGAPPGAAASMLKVQGSEALQALDELAMIAAAHYSAVHQPQARVCGANSLPVGPQTSLTTAARYFNNRAASIYGGSNEIQRNIMASNL